MPTLNDIGERFNICQRQVRKELRQHKIKPVGKDGPYLIFAESDIERLEKIRLQEAMRQYGYVRTQKRNRRGKRGRK